MIGLDAIERAAQSGDTGPQSDEIADVDTDAVATVAGRVMDAWMDVTLAVQALAGPEASYSAAWAHGFMAGVVAAREDERSRP